MRHEIEIIFQDENIVVVNKPTGILVIPDQYTDENKTLIGVLQKQLNQKILAVHKIDYDTTGVLLFAKSQQIYKDVSIQFENSKIHKKYIVLLSGTLEEEEGTINKPILVSGGDVLINSAGKESITNFKILERFKSYTLVQAFPLTARKHQIRVHFWSIGHPLAIDGEYGVSDPIILSSIKRNYKVKNEKREKPLISRLTLHAASLTLQLNGKAITFEAPLPKDFVITLKQLRKYCRVP
ncbi:MAG: RluA family pseudouridine synthase [Endomicrobium sp.]|jgi:23S rRNA pseudouridine955/2504/2580 synthase/23S rRNA pseudouridine1911/1915/1917 synthase|nr:RluA family pseudouridine synthase [Endomicrobium sp.]